MENCKYIQPTLKKTIAWIVWGYFGLFFLLQQSCGLSGFSDCFSPFLLRHSTLTHFFLHITWKVVAFKNCVSSNCLSVRQRTARLLCSGNAREQMVTLMPVTERHKALSNSYLWRWVIFYTKENLHIWSVILWLVYIHLILSHIHLILSHIQPFFL